MYPTFKRNRQMTITYLEGGITLAELGRQYGITGDRVRHIVEVQRRRMRWAMWRAEENMPVHVLLDPEPEAADIGEGVEWTPEAQYREFELIRKHR